MTTNQERIVSERGVRIDGAWFFLPELTDFIGQRVRVVHDENDPDRITVVARESDRIICCADKLQPKVLP